MFHAIYDFPFIEEIILFVVLGTCSLEYTVLQVTILSIGCSILDEEIPYVVKTPISKNM